MNNSTGKKPGQKFIEPMNAVPPPAISGSTSAKTLMASFRKTERMPRTGMETDHAGFALGS